MKTSYILGGLALGALLWKFAKTSQTYTAPSQTYTAPSLTTAQRFGGNWTNNGDGTYQSKSGNVTTTAYGTPNSVYDTLAVLRAANPGVRYSVNASGMIVVV